MTLRIRKQVLVVFWLSLIAMPRSDAQEIIHASPWGGKQQLKEFIDQEMVYPAVELQQGTEGRVIISTLVKSDGSAVDTRIVGKVSPALDAEALRIFNLILWNPAVYLGKPCDGMAEVEFEFSIKRYQKIVKMRGYEKPAAFYPVADSSGLIASFRETDVAPQPVFKKQGMDMQQFMAENFRYPDEALRQNITGTVVLKFIVEPHGRISNVKVEKHLGAGCSEEALRLIKLFTWTPGVLNGKAVRTLMTLSLSFSLSGGNGYSMHPSQSGISLQ